MFFYILYKIGYYIANILPLNVAYIFAEKCSDLQYFLIKNDRENVTKNLSIILNKDIGECRILARKVFRNFGLYLVDFFRASRLTKEIIDKKVEIVGIENIDKALKENRGAIVLTAHLGNWEMGGIAMALVGYDISAVTLNHKYKNINDFFIRQREEKGFKVISMSSVMKRCVSALKNGGLLALAGDRDFTNSGIVVDFFGMPTSIPKGAAALSLKIGSPIVPGFFVRKDNKSCYKLIFDVPIYAAEIPGISEDKIIKDTTEKFIPIMEKYIKMYPEQWLIFRKFWEPLKNISIL